MNKLKKYDIEVYNAVRKELKRERNTLELIASENFTSEYVLDIVGSILGGLWLGLGMFSDLFFVEITPLWTFVYVFVNVFQLLLIVFY